MMSRISTIMMSRIRSMISMMSKISMISRISAIMMIRIKIRIRIRTCPTHIMYLTLSGSRMIMMNDHALNTIRIMRDHDES